MMTCVLHFVKKSFDLEKDLLHFHGFQRQVNRTVSLDSFIHLMLVRKIICTKLQLSRDNLGIMCLFRKLLKRTLCEHFLKIRLNTSRPDPG